MSIERKRVFNPTLSFDGVTFLVAAVGLAVWMGQLKQKVDDYGARQAAIEQTVKSMTETQARLMTLIEERTRRTQP